MSVNSKFAGFGIKDLIYVGAVLITVGIMYGSVQENTKHRNDKTIHMPLDKKIEIFVTRREYNQFRKDVVDQVINKLNNIEDRLNKIGVK